MNRTRQLILLLLCSLSMFSWANVGSTSYPASLCYQSYGPEGSLLVNELGDVSNGSLESAITLSCPVVLGRGGADALEARVKVLNQSDAAVKCHIVSNKAGTKSSAHWGNLAQTEQLAELQTLTSRIAKLDTSITGAQQVHVSCTLPPASQSEAAVSLLSYEVVQTPLALR